MTRGISALSSAEAGQTRLWLALAALSLTAGCQRDMQDQAKYTPYAAAPDFPHRQSALPPVEGTVPHDEEPEMDRVPQPLTEDLLARGQERFDIFCSPCHGRLGDGNGMIVQRGFPRPPSYHTDRLRSAPDDHFHDVITHGFGTMYPYASRVSEPDRWAIVAYIRALQLSQHSTRDDLRELARQEE